MLDTLGEAALRSLFLAAVVQSVLWLLRIRQPRLLLTAWLVVLVTSIAMPMLPQFIPVRLTFDPALPGPLIESAADLLQPLPSTVADVPAPLPVWLWPEAVYAVVCCAILSRVLVGLGLSFQLLARAVPVRREWAAGQHVRISRDVTGPVTIANVILLPTDATTWSAEMREAVLAHERAHVTRWDFAMLAVSQLNRALFWFSPLPWWLHRRLIMLSELASDDQAMAATRDRLGYAEILLEMGRRSGRALRGPAMARPSTLLHRIDRILLDQASARPATRVQHGVLTAGMVSLSLGIAGLTCSLVPEPAGTPFVDQWRSPGEHSIAATLPIPEPGSSPRQIAAPGAVSSSPGAEARTEPQVLPRRQPVPPSASLTSSAGATATQASRSALPMGRLAPRTVTKAMTAALPPRAPDQPRPLAASPAGASGTAELQTLDAERTQTPADAGSGLSARPKPPAAAEARSSLPHQASYGSLSLQSGLESIAGSTCTGTVAVGMRAAGGSLARPNVVPGQVVPALAQFFRKDGAGLWVRFHAFGRPPLDLPVRFARNGMTWTGEYGIAYTVQAVGGDRLAGLASLVANDSAGLSFGCSRSTTRPL